MSNIKIYEKGKASKLSKNFTSNEFDCHGKGCCNKTEVDLDLIEILQKIRDHFGKSVHISSGYRCAKHNKNVGGATGSRHGKGMAADIYIDDIEPAEVAKYAESIDVKGIGLYETDEDGHFVHVDTRTTKSFWYGQAQKRRETFQEEQKIDTSKIDTSPIDEKIMWDFFKSKGLNDYGVAGLMGNLYAESTLRPTNLQQTYEKKLGMSDAEYTAAVDADIYTNFVKDSAGYGLAQWTYWTLKQDMLNYHKKANKSIGDGQTQMEFLVYQLSTKYSGVFKTLQEAKSIREASDAVLLKFERPADQSESVQLKRAQYGQKYYDIFSQKKEADNHNPTESDKRLTLRKGDEGEEVEKLQETLKKLGFDCQGIDGKFGSNTENAVRNFQIERELTPDGICGPKTWTEIDNFKFYEAIVTANLLNVRVGPGLNNRVKTTIRKNSKILIVYHKDGWGKLTDAAGWVSLDYIKKL